MACLINQDFAVRKMKSWFPNQSEYSHNTVDYDQLTGENNHYLKSTSLLEKVSLL